MSDHARALLPMLWLLASEAHDPVSGLVEFTNEKIAFRLRLRIDDVTKSINEIIVAGFAEHYPSCSESVTEPLPNRSQTVTPETEDIDLDRGENKTPSSSSDDQFALTPVAEKFTPQDMVAEWNAAIDHFAKQGEVRIPKVTKLTNDRDKKCRTRIKSLRIDKLAWQAALNKIHQSEFLTGDKPSATNPNWRADFDWVIKNDTVLTKIMEGGYE